MLSARSCATAWAQAFSAKSRSASRRRKVTALTPRRHGAETRAREFSPDDSPGRGRSMPRLCRSPKCRQAFPTVPPTARIIGLSHAIARDLFDGGVELHRLARFLRVPISYFVESVVDHLERRLGPQPH